MTRIFVELPIFRKRWKELGLNDTDLKRLQEKLLVDPKVGAVMRKTDGIEKCALPMKREKKAGVFA